MKPTALSGRRRARADAGFTLAEVLAGLFVAAALVSALGQVSGRLADATVRIRGDVETGRSLRLAQAVFSGLERADPQSIAVTAGEVTARVGGADVAFELVSEGSQTSLAWRAAGPAPQDRRAAIPASRFAQENGAIRLVDVQTGAALLTAYPRRRIAVDCEFDSVIKACR